VIFFILLLISVISLGSFGVVQKKVHDFSNELPPDSKCILFGRFFEKKKVNDKDRVVVKLPSLGPCGFALWGLVSIFIVAFVWFVYSIVMIAFGPPV
jgi:hypothetical protein